MRPWTPSGWGGKERKEGDSGLEEARTQTHGSTEWEEGSREGTRAVSPVEAEGQGPEAPEAPLPAQPFDNVGVQPAPTWTRL